MKKLVRNLLTVAAATTLGVAGFAVPADALSQTSCSSNTVDVEFTGYGQPEEFCYGGLGNIDVHLDDTAWVRAGQYSTWAEGKLANGSSYGVWINPGQKHVFGYILLENIFTEK